MPSKTKKSPGRPKKGSVAILEKSLERPAESVVRGFEGVSFLFLLGAIAAMVAWMVYVAKFNLDVYRNVDDNLGDNTVGGQLAAAKFSLKNLLTIEQYTICYQAVVSALLLYFAFKYHFSG